MQKTSLFIVFGTLLALNGILIDGKRTFSIGRSRKKSPNLNVRRKGAVPDVVKPPADHPGAGRPSGGHDAPPSYASVVRSNPPSYAEATRGANFPGQTYGPGGGNYPMGSSQLPSQGVYQVPGNTNYGGYGGGFGYGTSPFGLGNVMTGVAIYSLARNLNPHRNTEHIYIEKNSNPEVSPPHPNPEEVHHPTPFLLTTITPPYQEIPPYQSPPADEHASTQHPVIIENTTDHPSLWIYAINTIPIRSEVVVADKSSFD